MKYSCYCKVGMAVRSPLIGDTHRFIDGKKSFRFRNANRPSAYRSLTILGSERAKAISNGPSGGSGSRANSDLEKLKL